MTIEFKLPDLGENIEKADVGQVLVKEGDEITADQIVLELETEKAVFELPCPHAGKVSKIHVKPGDSISVGESVLTLEETAAAPVGAGAKEDRPESAKAKAPTTDAAQRAAEKTVADERKVPEPAKVAASAKAVESANGRDLHERDGGLPVAAAPSTRRLARKFGIDLRQVTGSGPGGRITREDVEDFIQSSRGAGGVSVAPALPDFSQWGNIDRQPLSKLEQTAAAHLTMCWQTIPHVTQHELVDVTDLEAMRKQHEKNRGPNGPKITMTVMAVKAVVAALKAFPKFNASFDPRSNQLILKQYYHIGIAVDTEYGLLVPVLRDADRKSVFQLAEELTELAEKSRNRKIELAELKGGTFTISNLGGIAGSAFTPIINHPEVAILGISRAHWQPVYRGDQVQKRLIMPLSLSYDHRVINGADGARFIAKLAAMLSDPFQLMIEG